MPNGALSEAPASLRGAAENRAGDAPRAAASARTPPLVDGLAPILIGLLWLLTQLLAPLGFNALAAERAAAEQGLGPFLLLALDETRSQTLWEAALPILLFAGFARAAVPWVSGRGVFAAPWLGAAACLLLSAAYLGWVGLHLSFAVPGLWPNPLDLTTLAVTTPPALYWADLAVLAALYAALMLFALQILLTLAAGLREGVRMVGPAALALTAASVQALLALPDDLRQRWSELVAQAEGGDVVVGETDGLAALAIARRDGLFYVYDQITLTVLDFIAIAAALAVLSVAVWRATGGVLRWTGLANIAVLSFALGAGFTLANVGFVHAETMALWLSVAATACLAPLFLLPVVWVRSMDDPQARRDMPAWWALVALLPSVMAAIAVPYLAFNLGDAVGGFELWTTAFNVLDLMLLSFVCFAGWYALQHRLTGRETARGWSAAHLLVAGLLSAGAAFGPYYNVFFLGAVAQWSDALTYGGGGPTEGLLDWRAAAGHALFLAVLFGEYVVFALGLARAPRLALSRMESDAAVALSAASRASAESGPKADFKSKTLFGKRAQDDEKASQPPAKEPAPAEEASADEEGARAEKSATVEWEPALASRTLFGNRPTRGAPEQASAAAPPEIATEAAMATEPAPVESETAAPSDPPNEAGGEENVAAEIAGEAKAAPSLDAPSPSKPVEPKPTEPKPTEPGPVDPPPPGVFTSEDQAVPPDAEVVDTLGAQKDDAASG